MKTMMSRTALTLITALAAGPALAGTGTGTGSDPALRVQLSQSPLTSLPVFILEVEALAGYEYEGEVAWMANEQLMGIEPVSTLGGQYLDVHAQNMSAEALICVELQGRLTLGGDMGRDVSEQACVVYVHDDAPAQPSAADRLLQKEELSRRPGSQVQPAVPRSREPGLMPRR